jgi:hypothetical protein
MTNAYNILVGKAGRMEIWWIYVDQGKGQGQALVSMVINLHVPKTWKIS